MSYRPDPRLAERAKENVAWLTTISPKGRPSPRPVWFVLEGDDIIVFSRPDTAKTRHIEGNPEVSLHFNSDEHGGSILVIGGKAEILPDGVASEQPGFLEKYEKHYPAIDYDVPKFDREYHVRIRIRPERTWGF
ncbi:PPOX class probable F420-dependent enzyme, Rv3369 family [Amycolatopsis lurida]|uniref:Pyridoxamine 5'-phosphate oxidase n=1 Tax=Amycolatopsis lurida NRRL 2430 TaxID=1460371 RepID=A0A2P2FQ47_AMYLU|nr:TIGR03667 family PPOX class F420-dependent oxidoreductase [Amycolatopsis lurida]KFU78848.1 pyridoxamine 5'-phosphate oxidase [Amycolatopsis lurida NRRL 2430]SED81322.1 PPOX class probable F420-dependent enzyme, Rv3369 family [Amycolatopsis lurida]